MMRPRHFGPSMCWHRKIMIMSMLLWQAVLGRCLTNARATSNVDHILKGSDGPRESRVDSVGARHLSKKKAANVQPGNGTDIVEGVGRNGSLLIETSQPSMEPTSPWPTQSTPPPSQAHTSIGTPAPTREPTPSALTSIAPSPAVASAASASQPPSTAPTGGVLGAAEIPDRERKIDFNTKEKLKDTLPDGLAAAALSFTACEKLDLALEFMTSLDFEEHFQQVFSYAGPSSPALRETEADIYADVCLLQLLATPVFLALLLCGARLFLHAFVAVAAAAGLFGVFGGAEGVSPLRLDCPMKLALSVIASFLCAVVATTFFRAGIFALGALAFGGGAYLAFDAFPRLDPGSLVFAPRNVTAPEMEVETEEMMHASDLSAVAWVITLFCSLVGGIFLRYFEMETLEIATATIGGIGCAYSIHTAFMFIEKPVDPALIFLIAFFTSVGGWRFQRRRRLRRQNVVPESMVIECSPLEPQRQVDEAKHLLGLQGSQVGPQSGSGGLLLGFSGMEQGTVEHQRQMEQSMMSLLQAQVSQQNSGRDGPSSEQVSDLTASINRFINALEEGKNKTQERGKNEERPQQTSKHKHED